MIYLRFRRYIDFILTYLLTYLLHTETNDIYNHSHFVQELKYNFIFIFFNFSCLQKATNIKCDSFTILSFVRMVVQTLHVRRIKFSLFVTMFCLLSVVHASS